MIMAWLRKLGRGERIGLAVAGGFMLVLLLDRIVVKSVVDKCSDLDQRLEENAANTVLQQRILDMAGSAQPAYDEIVGVLGVSESSAEAAEAMKEDIDNLADATGVVLLAAQHRETRDRDVYEECLVEVKQFESTLAALFQFLQEIRQSPGMMRVSRLTFGPKEDEATVEGSMLISRPVLVKSEPPAEP